MTTAVINTSIGESRSVTRLWLEGQKLAVAGVKIGVRYCMNVSAALKRVELRPAPNDYKGQTFLVSKRERNNIVSPLIEVRTDLFAEVFELGSKVRVAIRQGRIIVTVSHIASRVAERVKRFLDKLQGKEPLSVVSLFHGGGVLNKEVHSGLQKSGVSSLVQVGATHESSPINVSLLCKDQIWTRESISKRDCQEINFLDRNIPQCDVVVAGASCLSGGRSIATLKGATQSACPSEYGHAFVDFIGWVKAANPGIVLFEKDAGKVKATSTLIIQSVLVSLGYQLTHVNLEDNDGGLDQSRRISVVAFTPDIGIPVDVSLLEPLFDNEHRIQEVTEDSVKQVAPHVTERMAERVRRFINQLQSKQPLPVGSLFHGGGVLDKAMHAGLEKSGVASFVQVAVELEEKFLDASLRNNPELWSDESYAINSDIREINLQGSNTPQLCFLWVGMPCTGSSRAGASKNKLSCAEEHSAAGSMFIDFLDWVRASNPAGFVIECVPEYLNTASMMVIRSVLTSLGYVLTEAVLDGNELGALEKRRRMCVVGLTPGMGNPFDFGQLVSLRQKEACLQEVLEDIPLDSDRWKAYSYLADKQERDLAAGKGFKRQLLDGSATHCGTIGGGYAKGRSTEPFVIHPEDPELSRLLTPTEHARVKATPLCVIHGVAETTQHQILGQSIVYTVFEAVAYLLGLTIQGLTKVVEAASNVVELVSTVTPSTECFEQEVERFQTMRLFA